MSTSDVEIVDGCAAGTVIAAGGRIRDDMVTQGWLAEGDGPDRVVMCAPG